jgi:hypothetical protein
MPRNLLQIINQVQGELGLTMQPTIIGNTDGTTVQMLNLLTGLGDDLRRMHRWPQFEWEYIIEVAPALSLTGNLTANSAEVFNIQPNTTGIQPWTFQCQVPGIPTPARVVEIVSSSSLILSLESPTSQTGVSFLAAQDTYPIPVDFDFFTDRTAWDRTNRWELLGPDSPQMDQWHQSGVVPTGPRRHWRRLGPFASNGVTPGSAQGQFRLWPAPYEIASNLQLVWEYASLYTVATGGNFNVPAAGYNAGVPFTPFSQFWTSDTDQPLLDDDLLIKGLKWKFWEAKGFNYVNMKNDWIDYADMMYARAHGAKTLNLVKRVNPIFISPANVQDGFFPGPTGPNSF